MALLLRNGAVFLHIPKTGGTYVSKVLHELGLVTASLGHKHSDFARTFWHDKLHDDLRVLRHLLRRFVRSRRAPVRMRPGAFAFCFVREPLNWRTRAGGIPIPC